MVASAGVVGGAVPGGAAGDAGAAASVEEAGVAGPERAAPDAFAAGGVVAVVCASTAQNAKAASADSASLVWRGVEGKCEPMADEVLVSERPERRG